VLRTEVQRQKQQGRAVRLMFQDEARLGRMQDPRRAWAPPGVRPLVPTEIVREYGYAYAALSPHDGVLDSLVLPDVNAERMSLFLAEVARRHADEFILMVLDGAGWHTAHELSVPEHRRLYPLAARSPELNPVEHVWDEWREKWLCHRFFDCQEAVEAQVARGLTALQGNPAQVASLAGFAWITTSSLKAT
jgi:DDE superfamily endonuclease